MLRSLCLSLWLLVFLPFAVEAKERLELKGDFTQGGLIIGRTQPGARLRLAQQPVRVSPQGSFVFGFDRDAPAQIPLSIAYLDGRREMRTLTVAQRSYDIQRIEGLPAEKVTPPPEVLERIRQEAAQIAQARSRDSNAPYFQSGFRWPVAGRISGVYGSQRILNNEPRQPHNGIDISAPEGTPVQAPADGVVGLARSNMYYGGNTLILDHGHGLSSAFLHLKDLLVKEGQAVKQGDVIASVGATGRATGPHLHWGMSWFKQRIDPALLVPPR